MIITATVEGGYKVRLEATSATGTVSWVRRVRGQDKPVGDGVVVVDNTPPLNVDITYSATDDVSTEVAPAVQVQSDSPILSSPIYGDAYQVTVLRQDPLEWEARSVAIPILGRVEPLVSIAPVAPPTGTLVILMSDNGQRLQLLEMLSRGDPLQLRSTCVDVVDDVTFLPTSWSDPRLEQDNPRSLRTLEIEFTATSSAPTAYPPAPARTYADALAVGTFADITATFESWFDLRNG